MLINFLLFWHKKNENLSFQNLKIKLNFKNGKIKLKGLETGYWFLG